MATDGLTVALISDVFFEPDGIERLDSFPYELDL